MTKDEAIAQVLTTALDAAKKTGAWLQGQVPDVVHQLITFHIVTDIAQMVFAVLWLGALAYGFSRFRIAYEAGRKQYDAKHHSEWSTYDITVMPMGFAWAIGGGVVGGGGGLISIIALYCNTVELIELLVAPKVWLLEYAAHLVK